MTPAAYPVRVMVLAAEGGPEAPILPVLIDAATRLSDVLPDLREAVQTRAHVLLAATSHEALAPIEEALFELTQEPARIH